MRYLIASLSIFAWLFAAPVHAQNAGPFMKIAAKTESVGAGLTATSRVQCPAGWIPVGYSLKSKHAGKAVEAGTTVLDRDGTSVDLGALSDGARLVGGGYAIGVSNTNLGVSEEFEFIVMCFSPTGFSDGAVTWVKQTTMLQPNATTNLVSFCPGGSNAVGAVNNAGQSGFLNLNNGMIWGSSTYVQFLSDQPDGTTTPPVGWESTARNTTATTRAFTHWTVCGKLQQAITYVYSAIADSGTQVLAEYGAVPETSRVISYAYDAYYYAYNFYYYRYYWDAWVSDSVVAGQLSYYNVPGATYESTRQLNGISSRFEPIIPKAAGAPKASARVVFGITVLPSTAVTPAPSIIDAVEFYNSRLDHYFMTAIPQEISDLDTGTHPGWARTGQSFNVYAAGSSGHSGRHPVCRAYGNPSAGLDSHFYSASMEECYSTLSGFNDAWLLEASEIFQMDLPDPATGACPANDVPVYRVWNKRADSNHRYTTSLAIRDQMVARGYVSGRLRPGQRDALRAALIVPVPILGLAHIGIRVHDLERSVRFYELLGFTKTAGPIGPEPVAILDHPSGVEVNLILNATNANEANVLMDVPEKHAGITHFALLCPDILAAKERLEAAGIILSGGPVRFGPAAQAIFVRDPDRNVIELHQRG